MPNPIRELGNDRRGVLNGKARLLSHPQSINATVDAEIIIGSVRIVIAFSLIGFAVLVNQLPPRRLLAIEKHLVAFIERAVFCTFHHDGHLRQIVGTDFRVFLRQLPRRITEDAYLVGIQLIHINAHGLQRAIIQTVNTFLRHRKPMPCVLTQDRMIVVHLSDSRSRRKQQNRRSKKDNG